MDWIQAVVLSTVLAVSYSAQDLSFPPGFKFGAATAAYQVEGGWDEGGKGESIWDRFVHEDPSRIVGMANGDVACDSYHQWKKDIELAEELGLHYYRFSISWPRVLPTGFANYISEDGKNYYNNLIDGLLEKGIEPFVTMYHWDLPQSLQDLGGWTNPLIVDWFVDYARVLYTLYGDRVKMWLTINEPIIVCDEAYNNKGVLAPDAFSPEVGAYLCNKYVLLAHAKAWRLYDEEFKPKYHGRVSLTNQFLWFYPKTKEDEALAELARENCMGRYSHPIYSKEGGWPPSIEKHLNELSLKRGYPRSTFPAFTQEEIETIRGTYDYFAFNHYTSRLIRPGKEGEQFSAFPLGDVVDLNGKIEKPADWPNAASSWFFVHPEGIRNLMVWLKEKYGDQEFMIMENGLGTFGGLDDKDRVQYYRDYLEQILLAIKEDGINVTAYTAWTLIDNFEWMDGYNTVLAVSCSAQDLSFPPGFKFGAATAAYQVEGGWDEGGKGESVWDRFVHEDPSRIAGNANGDVACDSYHQWKKDIELAEELGLHYYRFSISWPRVLPSGFANYISEDGKNYYNNLIDGLLEKGIEPLVTMYHWDLPQSLQDLGGWTNPLIVDWFVDYARVLYTLYGDRVKMWLTLNEPIVICDLVYSNKGLIAPDAFSPEVGAYLCNKYVLLAHAKAWRLYDEEFKPKYHGRVSLANQFLWFYPKTKEDEALAELARENCMGRYSHPIYSKEGGWPPSIEKHMNELSLKRGYPRSTFPAFTQEEIETIRGTYDYFAFNHYTSRLIRPGKEGEQFSAWPLGDVVDLNGKIEKPAEWPNAASSWFFVHPEGIRNLMVWLKEKYGDQEFMIMENGLGTFGGLDDQDRVQYYRDYLEQILLAIKEDGVNVTAYTAWTLIDNFEWMDGYNVKFGLYEVDFNDPGRKRTPRASAHYYRSIIKSHSLDVPTRNEL